MCAVAVPESPPESSSSAVEGMPLLTGFAAIGATIHAVVGVAVLRLANARDLEALEQIATVVGSVAANFACLACIVGISLVLVELCSDRELAPVAARGLIGVSGGLLVSTLVLAIFLPASRQQQLYIAFVAGLTANALVSIIAAIGASSRRASMPLRLACGLIAFVALLSSIGRVVAMLQARDAAPAFATILIRATAEAAFVTAAMLVASITAFRPGKRSVAAGLVTVPVLASVLVFGIAFLRLLGDRARSVIEQTVRTAELYRLLPSGVVAFIAVLFGVAAGAVIREPRGRTMIPALVLFATTGLDPASALGAAGFACAACLVVRESRALD